jgi:hypothetical protein
MEGLDYERDTAIDPNALDVEWVQQPELMRRYTVHAANMKKEADDAKERLDVIRARLDMEIRVNPGQFGLEKVTEGAINATILLQAEYQKQSEVLAEARYEYDIAMAAVRALDQKKTALENLVRLLTASYFAGPQAPRDLSREWAEHADRRDSNARVKLTRTRRRKAV